MRIGDLQTPQLPTLPSADDGRLDDLRRTAGKGDASETARKFETLFAVMLVREFRRSMPESPFGEGAGTDVYEGWFDEHLGNALAQRDALGLAGMVKTAIGRAQSALDGTKSDDTKSDQSTSCAAVESAAKLVPKPSELRR